jgi:hypothetical protein
MPTSLAVPRALCAVALLAVPLAACSAAMGAAEPLVRNDAARDLDCPASKIVLKEELGGRYEAIGCGRKARYRTACEGITCEVRPEDGPAIPWRDRPDPGAPRP